LNAHSGGSRPIQAASGSAEPEAAAVVPGSVHPDKIHKATPARTGAHSPKGMVEGDA
jgi:hypothetical protein